MEKPTGLRHGRDPAQGKKKRIPQTKVGTRKSGVFNHDELGSTRTSEGLKNSRKTCEGVRDRKEHAPDFSG